MSERLSKAPRELADALEEESWEVVTTAECSTSTTSKAVKRDKARSTSSAQDECPSSSRVDSSSSTPIARFLVQWRRGDHCYRRVGGKMFPASSW